MFTFDENKAKSADGGQRITKGGFYPNTVIKEATYLQGNEQSTYMMFKLESSGQESDIQIYVKQKNGNEHYQVNQIQALMGILRIQKTSTAPAKVNVFGQDKDGYSVPEFVGKTIGVRLMKEEYRKQDGSIGFSMKLLNFMGPDNRTYSENIGGKEAKTYLIPVDDKVLAPEETASNSKSYKEDDQLPF